MPRQVAEHSVSVGALEDEGFDTGCVGAFCNTCVAWIGPHRDSPEEADGDARRHSEAVRQHYRQASAHLAASHFDQRESELMNEILQAEPENTPSFGPYFAYCGDCGGFVGLGRTTEQEAADDAQTHRAAFAAILAVPPL